MLRKGIRLLSYLKELILIAFFGVLGKAAASFCKCYKDVWLVSERGNDARDNGYWFYRYLKEEHPEINSYYIIEKDSTDYARVQPYGNIIEYRSFQHYLLYFAAKYIIGTHVQPAAPDKMMYFHLARRHIRPNAKQVFLQHGITVNDMSWLDARYLYIDLFVCGGKKEYEHIKENYHHPEGVVKYLGFSRFDHLITSAKKEKIILVMPTWRGSNYPSGQDFLNTEYYKHFQSLLNNATLGKILEEHGYRMVFYPHVEMQKYLNDFTTSLGCVTIAGKEDFDVQELLMNCSMLITDYSSVFFDVAYLEKPILYYAFDEEEFHTYHYKEGYFKMSRDGFGAVCRDEDTLLNEIERCFSDKMQMQDIYKDRTRQFFELRDNRNCERIYDAICSLQ